MQGAHLRARIPRRLDLLHGVGARAERPLRRAENADRALVTDADRARRRRQHVRDGRQAQAGLLAQLAAGRLLGRLPRLDEAAGQAVDALAELHAKLVDERDVLARSIREHHDDRVRAVVLQVLERVDVPVAADHLIRARAAGAVDIVQVVAVQERAAVLLFNVNELQCGSPLWS